MPNNSPEYHAAYRKTERGKEVQRRYDQKRHAQRIENNRRRRAERRAAMLEKLGGACADCGSTDRLEVDHVNGGGCEDRRERGLWRIYNDVLEGKPGFQLLCRPCHVAKTARDRVA